MAHPVNPFNEEFTAIIKRVSKLGYRIGGSQSHDRITITAISLRTGQRHLVSYLDGTDGTAAIHAARQLAEQVGLKLDDDD